VVGVAVWVARVWVTPDTVEGPSAVEPPLIVIDPGHGGGDGGTQGFGVTEKDVALDTAVRLARELRQRGLRTVLTRETDAAVPLTGRVDLTNAREAAALVSLHFNFSTESATVRGLEVLYSAPKELDAGRRLARTLGVAAEAPEIDAASVALGAAVREAACARARTPDRGTRNRPDLAVTRRTACPAVLVECAYLSNAADAQRAKSPQWRAELAAGLAEGIVAWLARQSERRVAQR
jgi:N-acetylmuramoyl-L-alanine amidase